MKFNAKNYDFMCKKRGKKGYYDMMVYDPTAKELYIEENVDESYVSGVDDYGNEYSSAILSKETFDIIYEKLFRDDGSINGFFDLFYDEEQTPKKKLKISKNTIFKAIRGQLSEEELDEVLKKYSNSHEFELADYYDFNVFTSIISKFMRGEISKDYYKSWLILVCNALNANKFKDRSKKQLLYNGLSYTFDGHAFDKLQEEKDIECRSMIAYLKDFNHILQNLEYSVRPPFYNENRYIVYVSFDFCNGNNCFYKLCVVDTKEEKFYIKKIINPDFKEDVNYTFSTRDSFEDLTNDYYHYYFDIKMDVSNFIVEGPEISSED